MDFKKMLKEKMNQADNIGNGNGNSRAESLPVTRISSKRPFFGRILPMGDVFPLVEVDRVFVPYTNQAGAVSKIPVILSKDGSDELTKLLKWVISTNYKYRESHQEFKKDIINLFDTPQKYNFHIIHRAYMVGLELNSAGNGYVVDQNGVPLVSLFDIPFSAYNNLLKLLSTTPAFQIEGHPFKDDMQFLTADKTFPISIKFDGNTNYLVNARPDIVLDNMGYNYLEKDENGYKYFADPYEEAKTLKETNPSMYKTLLGQIRGIVREQYELLKQSEKTGSTTPTPQVSHQPVSSKVAPVNTQQNSQPTNRDNINQNSQAREPVNTMDFMKKPSEVESPIEDNDFESSGDIDAIMNDLNF